MPISDQNKQDMADYLRAGLNVGDPRDELLEKLAEKYHRSTRQIERYISQYSPFEQEQGRKWIIPKGATQKERIEEVRREKAKPSSEQVPSQVASGQPRRPRLTVEATVVDVLPEKHSRGKKRHLVKAIDPRMTWCGHSLDGDIHLFWTNKIELCTCSHCLKWYNYAATGIWPG